MSNSDPSPTPPSSGDKGDHEENINSNEDAENKNETASSSAATNQSPPLHDDDTTTAPVAATAPKPTEDVGSTSSLFDDGENTLEEAFALIQKGNKLQKGQKRNGDDNNDDCAGDAFWEASFAYCKAQAILHNLALTAAAAAATANEAAVNNIDNDDDDDSEVNKIRALYQQQSREYFFKARQALVSAMMQESARDYESNNNKYNNNNNADTTADNTTDIDIYETLSDVNAMDRLTLFARLYARESVLLKSQHTNNNDKKNDDIDTDTDANNVQEQQSSLEDRLMKLNQSLPSGFKTSEERMRDINRGLNRLGLSSLITTNNSTTTGPFSMLGHQPLSSSMPVKSEFDQVEDIIAQARDEVALQQQQYGIPDNSNNVGGGIGASGGGGGVSGGGGAVPSSNSLAQDVAATLLSGLDHDDNDEIDDSLSASLHDQDESETFVDLTADDIRCIQEYVNEAQSQLAQLNAMLQLDGGANNDIAAEQQHRHAEIEFDPSSGRHKLLQARKCLALANRKFAILEE